MTFTATLASHYGQLGNNKTGNIDLSVTTPKQVSGRTRFIKNLTKVTGDGQRPRANLPPEVKKAAQEHLGKNAEAAKRKIDDVEDKTAKRGAGGLAGLQARPGYHLPGSNQHKQEISASVGTSSGNNGLQKG